jgi:hypothetical protein
LAMRPERPPAGAWETPWGVDVFFIHPTTAYAGDAWNAPVNDPKATARLDNAILPNHAGPFLHAGPVYAPRYRQAALHAELDVGGQGDKAFLLAYDDVLRAFDYYLSADNRGRAILLAGVGQGGLHALRLLEDRFQEPSLKHRLAAAYIIDAAVPLDLVGARLSQPVCDHHAEIHCIVSWTGVMAGDGSARRLRKLAPVWSKNGAIESITGRETACVNPLLWSATGDLGPRADHRGAARAAGVAGVEPHIVPGAVSARCADGLLTIDQPSVPDFKRATTWGARYKAPEFNLFYADIAFNAAERSRAASVWLDENGPKPAKPLPPPISLGEAPIHRPGGIRDPVR